MQQSGSALAYDRFRSFLQSACGILLGDNKEYLVNSRLKPVLAKNGLRNLNELVEVLERRSSIALREEVVDAMTTNETLWFRDLHPFRILDEKLFAELDSEINSRTLNIWSAACSTGQEPYSIAMVADEFRKKNPGKLAGGLRITATDISPSVLEKAKLGVYEMLALGRGMSDERLRRYFQGQADGRWQVNADIRAQVAFRSLNLLQSYSMLPGSFDIVFCRNVLIYFSQELKLDILTRIHAKLRKGGYLFLGASESMAGLSDRFDMVQCHPGIIYRAK